MELLPLIRTRNENWTNAENLSTSMSKLIGEQTKALPVPPASKPHTTLTNQHP